MSEYDFTDNLELIMKKIFELKKRKVLRLVTILIVGLVGIGLPIILYAEELMVKEETLLNAPAKAVWALVGGFQVLDRWHPAVVSSTLLGTGKEIGDIRVLTLNDNANIVERLEFYDDDAMTFRYQILESPLPVKNYRSSVTVKSAEDGKTIVIWQSSFKAEGASNDEAKKTISSIYLAGFELLAKLFN